MNARRLGILVLLGVLVLGAAVWRSRPAADARNPDVGRVLLPALAAHLDSIRSIRLLTPAPAAPVTLEATEGGWRVKESEYPADAARVRRLLLALAELKIVEVKTADPARYATLGVEEPTAPGAKSLRIELEGTATPTALIVGRSAATQGSFVRVPGTAATFEVRPALDVARTAHDWLERGFLDLPPARIAAIRVERAGEPPWSAERAVRGAEHFTVPNLPKGAELTNLGAPDSSAAAFGNLEFDEVRATLPPPAGEKRHRTVIECFDGLIVTLTGAAAGPEHWLSVEAHLDAALAARFRATAPKDAPSAEAIAREAARLNATVAGHEYKVAAYRFDAIFRPRSELLRH